MTGTSIRREASEGGAAEQSGLLMFYKTQTLSHAHQIGFSTGSVVAMDWSPKLNQLFVGTSTGKVHCLYDPIMSNKGIMLGLAKTPRKPDPGDQFQCVHSRLRLCRARACLLFATRGDCLCLCDVIVCACVP